MNSKIVSSWQPFQPNRRRGWTRQLAAHLFRRAGFGGTVAEIELSAEEGLTKTLDRLFDLAPVEPFEQEMASAGRMVGSGAESRWDRKSAEASPTWDRHLHMTWKLA